MWKHAPNVDIYNNLNVAARADSLPVEAVDLHVCECWLLYNPDYMTLSVDFVLKRLGRLENFSSLTGWHLCWVSCAMSELSIHYSLVCVMTSSCSSRSPCSVLIWFDSTGVDRSEHEVLQLGFGSLWHSGCVQTWLVEQLFPWRSMCFSRCERRTCTWMWDTTSWPRSAPFPSRPLAVHQQWECNAVDRENSWLLHGIYCCTFTTSERGLLTATLITQMTQM